MSPDTPSGDACETVRLLYRLFGEGRLAETLDLMDPDVILSEPGNSDVLPWAGEFRGHTGVQQFYDGLATGLSSIEIDPQSLEVLPVGGGRVLVLGTERGMAKTTQREYVTRSAWLWTVEAGRITRLTAFHDTEAMVAAFV